MKYPSEKEKLKQLGLKIKSLRLKNGYSQTALCYESEIDISTLSRLEGGKLNPSFKTLYKIAQVLEVDIKDFFD